MSLSSGDLAERVLLALTRHHVIGDDGHTHVVILMSPHDVRLVAAATLWGQTITEAFWVADGHPEVEITVMT